MPDGGPGLTAVGKQLVIVCEHHCRHLQSKHTENKLLRTVFTHTKNSDSQSYQYQQMTAQPKVSEKKGICTQHMLEVVHITRDWRQIIHQDCIRHER